MMVGDWFLNPGKITTLFSRGLKCQMWRIWLKGARGDWAGGIMGILSGLVCWIECLYPLAQGLNPGQGGLNHCGDGLVTHAVTVFERYGIRRVLILVVMD